MHIVIGWISVPLWEGNELLDKLGAHALLRISAINAIYPQRERDYSVQPNTAKLSGTYIETGAGENGVILTTLDMAEVVDLIRRNS